MTISFTMVGKRESRYKHVATKCQNCGKGSMMANKRKLLRGNYNPVNRYRKYPNLQWARLDGKRVKICTSCIKTLAKS